MIPKYTIFEDIRFFFGKNLEKILSSTKNISSPPIFFQFLRFIYFENDETMLYKLIKRLFQKLVSRGFYKKHKLKVFYGNKKNSNI